MRVPPSRDGATPTDRTPEPVRGGPWTSHGHPIAGLTIHGPGRPSVARCGGPRMCNKCATEQARLMEAARIDDDRTETITDRAAIRDSDEPSERGDFPYYDLGPATSETVGAPCEHSWAWVSPAGASGSARLCQSCHQPDASWLNEITDAEDALARVTREAEALRAQAAAVEARVVEWEALRDRLRAQNPVRKTGSSGLHRREANTLDVVAEKIRAALATGEGK